jgi:hypothetical protein
VSNSTRPSSNTSSTSSYDERFVVPLEASRRGAHRARVSPVMAVLPVAAVVGIVVGAIAMVYIFLGGLGDGDAGTTATTTAAPSTSSSTAASTAASSTSASGTAGAIAGTVDKTIPLTVYNGTSPTVTGLARKAGTKLTAAGWSVGTPESWTGSPLSTTTVYYGRDEQRASALAVVKVLGRGSAKLSASKAGTGMAVVIANDYPGAGVVHASTTARVTTTKSSTAGGSATKSPTGTRSASSSTSAPATSASTTTSSST